MQYECEKGRVLHIDQEMSMRQVNDRYICLAFADGYNGDGYIPVDRVVLGMIYTAHKTSFT